MRGLRKCPSFLTARDFPTRRWTRLVHIGLCLWFFVSQRWLYLTDFVLVRRRTGPLGLLHFEIYRKPRLTVGAIFPLAPSFWSRRVTAMVIVPSWTFSILVRFALFLTCRLRFRFSFDQSFFSNRYFCRLQFRGFSFPFFDVLILT